MRVAIAGAGAVGRSIARELISKNHDVLLIDKDPTKVDPDRIKGAKWLLGDACEVANLEEAHLEDCDVVVGATGDDKVNLVVSLLAKTEYAVRRVVARINHPANEWLFTEAWGVDVAVSTPRVLASLVEEAVEVGDIVRLFGIREGQANLVELTLPDGRPVRRQPGARPRPAEGHDAGRHRARAPGDHPDAGGTARGRRRAAVRRPARRRGRPAQGGARRALSDPRAAAQSATTSQSACVPVRPLSSTSPSGSNAMPSPSSRAERRSSDTRISPPCARAATRAASATLRPK